MRRADLQPGTVIKNGGSIFEIAQVNLFLRPDGRVMGGTVYPVRDREPRLVKGFEVRAILQNGKRTRRAPTIR